MPSWRIPSLAFPYLLASLSAGCRQIGASTEFNLCSSKPVLGRGSGSGGFAAAAAVVAAAASASAAAAATAAVAAKVLEAAAAEAPTPRVDVRPALKLVLRLRGVSPQ
jgi:hypothetical protein